MIKNNNNNNEKQGRKEKVLQTSVDFGHMMTKRDAVSQMGSGDRRRTEVGKEAKLE